MSATIISAIPNDVSLLVYRELHRHCIRLCLQEMDIMLEWREDVSWYRLRNGKTERAFNFRQSPKQVWEIYYLAKQNITVRKTGSNLPRRYWYSSGLTSVYGYK